ncbi:MAG: RraA family protein [Actinomycetota bacterium]
MSELGDAPAGDPTAELTAHGTATLGECGARRMRSRIRPVWDGARVTGRAVPVRCTPGDNLAIHVGVARAGRASVLVVDVGDEPELGYWGEVLTTAAEARGIAGLVIDGCVRDVAALAAHGFPVFSAGIALTGATKHRSGSVGEAVQVGEVHVDPGDWIVADVDGVVVVPHATLADVLAAARARTGAETDLFAHLAAGRTTLELLALDPAPIAVTPPTPDVRI